MHSKCIANMAAQELQAKLQSARRVMLPRFYVVPCIDALNWKKYFNKVGTFKNKQTMIDHGTAAECLPSAVMVHQQYHAGQSLLAETTRCFSKRWDSWVAV